MPLVHRRYACPEYEAGHSEYTFSPFATEMPFTPVQEDPATVIVIVVVTVLPPLVAVIVNTVSPSVIIRPMMAPPELIERMAEGAIEKVWT